MRLPLLTALAVALTASVATPGRAETLAPTISVAGEATVAAVPDLATIDAGVTMEAKTAREASDLANAAMGKVMLAMKNAGIAQRDVQTNRLSLQPQFPEKRGGPAAVPSFRASNRVSVKLRDITLIATTLDLLVGAGITEIGGVDFSVEQTSKLLDDARTQAIADARRKAEIYAKAAGVELGAALSISEGGAAAPVFARRAGLQMAAAPIAPGEETLRVSVAVTWAIKIGNP